VLELGRRLVGAGRSEAVPLLGRAPDQDLAKLSTSLLRRGGADLVHRLGLDLLDLAEGRDAGLAPLLIWLAEATPCSFCRHGAIERLIELDALLPELALEAIHDSNDQIRMLVARHAEVP
jgi:hypothetical protein